MRPEEARQRMSELTFQDRVNAGFYRVVTNKGLNRTFIPNDSQLDILSQDHPRTIILKARQIGSTTLGCLRLLDYALFHKDARLGLCGHKLDSGSVKLLRDKISWVYHQIPYKSILPKVHRDSDHEIAWDNGSRIEVASSLRGGSYMGIHITELAPLSRENRPKAEEIISGTLAAGNPDFIVIESTAAGPSGVFYESWMNAIDNSASSITHQDYKPIFQPWWIEKSYRNDAQRLSELSLPKSIQTRIDELQSTYPHLVEDQLVWYAKQAQVLSLDKMLQEYPCSWQEAFEVSLEHTIFAKLVGDVVDRGDLTRIAYNPDLPVHTAWDFGHADATSIWFFQQSSNMIHVIDFLEDHQEQIPYYFQKLQDRGYTYGTHFLPHDARNETLQSISLEKQFRKHHLRTQVIPRVGKKIDSILLAKRFMTQCRFDKRLCEDGIKHLRAYSWKQNKLSGQVVDEPEHNQASHAADAFQTMAAANEKLKQRSAFKIKKIYSGRPALTRQKMHWG